MSHINSLELCRFRGFHDVRLDNLGKINLIFGPNNCGKSSVLEALYLLCRPMDYFRWKWLPALRHRQEFGLLPGNECVGWFFPQRKNYPLDELLIKVGSQIFPIKELRVKKEDLDREYIVPKEEYKIVGETKVNQNEPGVLRTQGISKRYSLMDIIKMQADRGEISLNFVEKEKMLAPSMSGVPYATNISDTELAELGYIKKTRKITNYHVSVSHIMTPKKLVRNIMPFDFGANEEALFVERENYCSDIDYPHIFIQPRAIWGKYEFEPCSLIPHIDVVDGRKAVIQLLQTFDPEIKSFESEKFSGNSHTIFLEHADFATKVPLECFGEGMKRAFVLIASAAAARDGLLLVDEIETGLHFSAMLRTMKALILAAQAFNVQIFLTTHSLEAIDALLDAARETDSISEMAGFSLNADKTKQPKRFDGQMMQRLRFERGFEVR